MNIPYMLYIYTMKVENRITSDTYGSVLHIEWPRNHLMIQTRNPLCQGQTAARSPGDGGVDVGV